MSAHFWRVARVVAAACGAASVAVVAQGCFSLGRQYGPSYPQKLVPVAASAVAAQQQRADGELPIGFCRTACSDRNVQGCHLATLSVSVAADPEDLPVGSPLVQCHGFVPGGSDMIIR